MYRLHYDDLIRLANKLNLIHKGKVPFNHEQWSAKVLMGIRTYEGGASYICDMNQPH